MFFTLRFSCYAIELNEIIAIIAIVNLAANRICLFFVAIWHSDL